MAAKILVVDDDPQIVTLISMILEQAGFQSKGCLNGEEALEQLMNISFDLIVSDFFMPNMDGKVFLHKTREMEIDVPFVFLTANDNVDSVIEMFRDGATDYFVKPINPKLFIYRISTILENYENKKIVERVKMEEQIRELENKKIANWRVLYAYKDSRAIDQLITLLRRNIDQSGGYTWIEILKNKKELVDENHYKIEKNFIDLIIELIEKDKQFFELLSYISFLDDKNFEVKDFTLTQLDRDLEEFIQRDLSPILSQYEMTLNYNKLPAKVNSRCQLEMDTFKSVIKELIINAIKYSVPRSRIDLFFEFDNFERDKMDLIVRNRPRAMSTLDLNQNVITGIPFHYSELVFDIFYTIEPYTNRIKEEEWIDGTGLYICRKILKMQNCTIFCHNSNDFTGKKTSLFNNMNITIPLVS